MSALYKDTDLTTPVVSIETPDLLDCESVTALWVSWRGGFIRFGTGSVAGENPVLSYLDPDPYNIHAIALGAGGENTANQAEYTFGQIEGEISCQYNKTIIITSEIYNDITFIISQTIN